MRIISGKYKRRTIVAPEGDVTRPTSDRARESLFNVLVHNFDLAGAKVLDLFAGSGAFGLEALSRGALSVCFVERDREALTALEQNIKTFGIKDEAIVSTTDVYKWLTSAKGEYDIVFADPPYDDDRTLEVLPSKIFSSGLLTDDSLVIVEHRRGSSVKPIEGLSVIKEVAAGEAHFTILRTPAHE